jgi:hypothetical protein
MMPLGKVDCSLEDIEYREVPISVIQQVIHQRRCSPADVDNKRRAILRSSLHFGQRGLQVRTEPAHLVSSLGLVDPSPCSRMFICPAPSKKLSPTLSLSGLADASQLSMLM